MRFPKRLAALAAGMITLLTVSVAFAAWTANGTGSGQAKAVVAQGVTLAGSGANAQLYPGATGSLVVTVSNPNPYPVSVTKIVAGAVASITSDKTGCAGTTTGLSYNWTEKTLATPVVVAANSGGDGTHAFTLTGALTMGNSSDASCSGATFTVPVSVTAASAAGSAVTDPATSTVAVP